MLLEYPVLYYLRSDRTKANITFVLTDQSQGLVKAAFRLFAEILVFFRNLKKSINIE